jgi:DNA-binding CsgD family transcriptional regulator
VSDPSISGPYGTNPTARELDVLEAFAITESYARAGQRLGITENTVRNTLANVRSRLGCRTSLGAYRTAVREHWIDPHREAA